MSVQTKLIEVQAVLDNTTALNRSEYKDLLEEVVCECEARLQALEDDGEDE